MRIGIVGCGFVADYYLKTLPLHPQLELVGVMDRDPQRSEHFSRYHSVPQYASLEALLEDPQISIVLNLTNPRSHFQVSQACLNAGKHVYSEKPLSMNLSEAKTLVDLAESKNLYLASAPCNILSETAQTIWKALREQVIGNARLVYAEMDDGMVHQMAYKKWKSESGIPWPYKDEFEVGCTLEHAGYYINWLTAFFGPVKTVTAFSSCLIPDKKTDSPLEVNAPDFSVACLEFHSGIVARLTCSIVAPHDHHFTIIGDQGLLSTKDCWYYRSPVYIQKRLTIRRKTFISPWKQKYPLVGQGRTKYGYKGSQEMDFCRGVAELAEAITDKRSCRLSAQYSLHINEIVLAIQESGNSGKPYQVTTTFEPVEPMPWAK
ncbi:Gfo/Idh/MocA family protein [Crocosphaera sp.]|uniref:Gfo/Idh/MocA family protein n=1 Tax=Crocosphaera sp. TaxID=2729996 RepID=UPI003F25A0DD|nr:Gfo/Idh/MocA family oxidoreductase [Crocosphaera sp.]